MKAWPENTSWLQYPDECATASDASLRRALLTEDGRGIDLKKAALEELLLRARNADEFGK